MGSRQNLFEVFKSSKLVESQGTPTRKGCLGTISGPCADYKNVTRNGTFYSRKLWENVFNSDLVKEALEDRVLLGELDHPSDRLETKAANACIVMTGYSFDDDNQVVNGTFDILDTNSGRVLKSLLDYGCKIGVSSRGEGDIETVNGVDRVDEDTYYFVGFDAVALPSVKKAKPTLTESVQHKSLKESLMKEVEEATSTSQLEMIKNVLKATDMPEIDSLMESIDIKSKELSEGTTSTEDTVLLEDLETANNRIKELEGTINTLNGEITTSNLRIQRIVESNRRLLNKVKSLRSDKNDLETNYSNMVFESASSSKKIKSLEESLKQKESRIKELSSEVRTTCSSSIKINNEVRSLSEAVREADRKRIESEKKLSEAINKSRSKDDKVKSLEESVKVLESKEKSSISKIKELESRNAELLSSYVKVKASSVGIDPKVISESIKPNMSLSDIDKLVESIVDQRDRYSSLKITRDTLLSSYDPNKVSISSNQRLRSEKDQESLDFMKQAMGKVL